MKQSILTSLFIFLATVLFAQNNTKDKTAIRNIIQQQEQAWNRHDWEAFSSNFTDDATLINFVGQFWKGRSEILAHFKLLNDCCLAPTSLKFEIKQERFLTVDMAIVYIEETLFADKDYDVPFRQYKKGDIDYKWRIDIFERKNGEWKVTATQMTLINQMVSPHNSSDKH
jgi:uncharacterized protein (TIGR02246 family)